MKLKALTAALVIAATSQTAMGAILNSQTGNGELFMNIFDPVGERTYVRDLGILVSDFLPTGSMTTAGSALTIAPDTLLQSWLAAASPTALNSMVWNIAAMDSAGSWRYLTTEADSSTPLPATLTQTNGQVSQYQAADVYVGAVNAFAGHAVDNGSSSHVPADGAAYSALGYNWSTKSNFSTVNPIGTSSLFYLLKPNGTNTTGTLKALSDKFDNEFGDSIWLLEQNGTLNYTAASAAVSAVPVPAAAWLLGSGLVGLVGVARRKKIA